MESINPQRDFIASKFVIENSIFRRAPGVFNYGSIFYRTNEDLIRAYTDIDFYEKDVLSVLSSGDHVLTARYLEAETVEAFDKNKLTLYYFYLRLWSIKYRNELYPRILINGTDWLKELLAVVEPKTEMEQIALDFFNRHLNENTCFKELFINPRYQPPGKTPYRDCSELKNYLSSELTFYNYNFFERFEPEKEYDIVLMSNILEWAQRDSRRVRIIAENLSKLTKSNGIVICSKLMNKAEDAEQIESKAFEPNFEYEPMGNAYVYRRK